MDDEFLLRIFKKIQECIRNSYLLSRFGGEEVVIVLEPFPLEMVQVKLDRFRSAIECYQLQCMERL